MVAVDATGEEGWLHGSEDVAGDGLGAFMQQERSIDIRSAYAATTDAEFYFRLYVSDTSPPGGNVSGFVFIDVDRNTNTGGSAEAPEIDPRFSSDTSPGGYEYVFAVDGNGGVRDLWAWDEQAGEFAVAMVTPNEADAESGEDIDPITSSGDEHGYMQGWIELDLVGLDAACAANLYFRSLNETAGLGDGDLEVGLVGPCRPGDSNNDGVPDRIVPDERCSTDEQCPANAICIDGRCLFTGLCAEDSDCDSGEECNAQGYCILEQGDSCSANTDCETRLCQGGSCVRCGNDADCDDGTRCGADGRCIGEGAASTDGDPGLVLNPDDEVQGGACTCAVPGRAAGGGLTPLLFPALWLWRRRS